MTTTDWNAVIEDRLKPLQAKAIDALADFIVAAAETVTAKALEGVNSGEANAEDAFALLIAGADCLDRDLRGPIVDAALDQARVRANENTTQAAVSLAKTLANTADESPTAKYGIGL